MDHDIKQEENWLRAGKSLTWLMESSKPITKDIAQNYQWDKGYNPCGYGFFNFKTDTMVLPDETIKHIASWSCWSSCE